MKLHLLWDKMGVIFQYPDDIEDVFLPLLRTRQMIDENAFRALYYRKLSIGRITSEAFFDSLGIDGQQVLSEYIPHLRIDPDFIKTAQELAKTYELSILSNDVIEWHEAQRRYFQLDDVITHHFISGELGMRKPDGTVYDTVVQRLRTTPDRCIYTDNLLKNLEPAGKKGMTTIHFDREGNIKEDNGFEPNFTVHSLHELKNILQNTSVRDTYNNTI
ncbi:MAG: HAD hydrolase-like protein [archaeon]